MVLKWGIFLALAAVLAVILVACGQSPTTTSEPTGSTPTATSPGQPPSDQVLDDIAESVSLLRGLEPLRAFDRAFMSRSELHSFLEDELKDDREDILHTQSVWSILGLIPEDTDLFQLYLDLFTEQVLGLYDPETDQMYVIADAGEFGPLEESTLAHEYVHALQQQHFDIQSLDESVEGDTDASDALSALIEGDAYVQTFEYILDVLTLQEQVDLSQISPDTTLLDQAPYVLREQFSYVFEEGVAFVQAILDEGGQGSLNKAFLSPPVSTEHVLHPEKYFLEEEPVPVTLPDLAGALGEGWSELDTDTLGEFLIKTYLETTTGADVAEMAAAGWGGDRYVLLGTPLGDTVLAALTVWDTEEDAQEFFQVALAPLTNVPDRRYAEVQGDRVYMVVAPTDDLIDMVKAHLVGM